MTANVTEVVQRLAAEIEAEEAEAAFHEGAVRISDEAYELVERYLELKRQMKPLQAELDGIRDLVKGEMREKNVSKLTRDGVVVVEEVPVHKKVMNIPALLKKFPLAVRYLEDKVSTRFDVKK